MRYFSVFLFFATTSCVTANDPLTMWSWPIRGIPVRSYSNVCQELQLQIPTNSSILKIEVRKTDKVLVVTGSESSNQGTNAVAYVFVNQSNLWVRAETRSAGKTSARGLNFREIQDIVSQLEHIIPSDQRVLFIWLREDNLVDVMTGELKGGTAGGGDSFVFTKSNNKWIFKRKGQWKA
ncbi:MAG: hypothetical protein PHR77_16595 [Kiritimatiellae bacterium]|nr:hypothetical protein [Kiritimatiellia bacterium]MDD5521614.1 hypothetical protein [Kiritimatiellia bacterium]